MPVYFPTQLNVTAASVLLSRELGGAFYKILGFLALFDAAFLVSDAGRHAAGRTRAFPFFYFFQVGYAPKFAVILQKTDNVFNPTFKFFLLPKLGIRFCFFKTEEHAYLPGNGAGGVRLHDGGAGRRKAPGPQQAPGAPAGDAGNLGIERGISCLLIPTPNPPKSQQIYIVVLPRNIRGSRIFLGPLCVGGIAVLMH